MLLVIYSVPNTDVLAKSDILAKSYILEKSKV